MAKKGQSEEPIGNPSLGGYGVGWPGVGAGLPGQGGRGGLKTLARCQICHLEGSAGQRRAGGRGRSGVGAETAAEGADPEPSHP